MKKALIYILMNLSVIGPIHAQNTTDRPTYEFIPGGVPTLTWKDGKKAVLKFVDIGLRSADITFSLVENLCNQSQIDPECKMTYYTRPKVYTAIWQEHTDKSKIGTPVLKKNGEVAIRDSTFVDDFLIYKMAWPSDMYKYHELKCKNDAFFDKLRDVKGAINIALWSSESNFTNSETNVSENQTLSGAYGVHLRRTSQNSYTIHSVDSLFINFIPPFAGQVSYWAVNKPNGGTCDIKFTQNIMVPDSVTKEIAEAAFTNSKTPSKQNYLGSSFLLFSFTALQYQDDLQ